MSSTYTGKDDSDDTDSDEETSEISESAGVDSSMKKKMWESLKKKYLAAQNKEQMMGNDRESESDISESK
jgi:hypothetical protein